MLIIYLIVFFLISFVWALISAKRELGKPKEIKKAKANLRREKILFKK